MRAMQIVNACAVVLLSLLCIPGALSAQTLPAVIPIFPLPEVVLFPTASRPLYIFEPRYKAMIADAMKGDRIIGTILLRPGFEQDSDGRPPIYEIGTAGQIVDFEELPGGQYAITLKGFTRFRVTGEDQGRPYRLARVTAVAEQRPDADLALLSSLREKVAELFISGLPPNVNGPDPSLPDEGYVNIIAQYVNVSESERQSLLELGGPILRARRLIDLMEGRP
jgi:uncharacterized protein